MISKHFDVLILRLAGFRYTPRIVFTVVISGLAMFKVFRIHLFLYVYLLVIMSGKKRYKFNFTRKKNILKQS